MNEDDPDLGIGSVIQQLRQARGMSQADLAAKLGDSFRQQTILKLEKGQRSLKLHEAVRIAEIFNIGLEALLISDSGALAEYQRIKSQIRDLKGLVFDFATHADDFEEGMRALHRAIRAHQYWSFEEQRELEHDYQELIRNTHLSLREYAQVIEELPSIDDPADEPEIDDNDDPEA